MKSSGQQWVFMYAFLTPHVALSTEQVYECFPCQEMKKGNVRVRKSKGMTIDVCER